MIVTVKVELLIFFCKNCFIESTICSTKNYLLVMEYANSGTLRNYLRNNFHRLTWDNKYSLAYQLASSVLCLHEEGIVHRDLVIF
jgi:serine/threonine protein kinase